ncbi:MAG TPA: CGNR zinc finger domain-containing protein [Streptosporangiaceae bacterium]|nr:CGNR zinc finger domain-containing protein [Streptosporangiaceae bacterium]
MFDGNYELPTAGRDPGDRAPAPGSLRLVQALVNTLAVEFERDLLATPDAAAGWLATAGLWAAGPLSGAQLGVLAELREACRGVLWAHTERRGDPAAAARLATALGSCRLTLAAGPGGDLRLDCADHDPFARAVGAVATAIAEASVAGTWDRLKSCPGHLCGWAFYDRSPAGRSRWCSMQVCGARTKMRAYRGRPATRDDA